MTLTSCVYPPRPGYVTCAMAPPDPPYQAAVDIGFAVFGLAAAMVIAYLAFRAQQHEHDNGSWRPKFGPCAGNPFPLHSAH